MAKCFLTTLILMMHVMLSASDIKMTLAFSKEFNTDNLQITLDDGGVNVPLQVVFKNNTGVLKATIKSTYASLLIFYAGAGKQLSGRQFLIDSSAEYIKFEKSFQENPLSNYRLKNVYVFYKSPEMKALENFGKMEYEAMIKASDEYALVANDSTLAALIRTGRTNALKNLEYIKLHGNNYWYFWFFCSDIVGRLQKTHQLELYEIFNTAFPEKFKNSYEGQNTKKLLIGSIGFKHGDPVPDFSEKDIYGNPVSAQMNRGKYMLICFWATWCSPCVEEIPFLKKLRSQYRKEDLEIISISVDRDSLALIKGIEKYQMNWTHVLSANTNLKMLFGNKPIPGVYLVSPAGTLQFSNWTDGDHGIIEKILKENIAGASGEKNSR